MTAKGNLTEPVVKMEQIYKDDGTAISGDRRSDCGDREHVPPEGDLGNAQGDEALHGR